MTRLRRFSREANVQGLVGVTLVVLGAGLIFGLGAACVTFGALVLLDDWLDA